jgi:hypothetical protein
VRRDDVERVARIVLALPRDTRIVVGACVGAGSYVALVAHASGYHVHAVVPVDRGRAWYAWREHCTTFEEQPNGSGDRERHARIAELSDRIVAIAEAAERDPRSRRSRTWTAVRDARMRGKRVDVHVLDGARSAAVRVGRAW